MNNLYEIKRDFSSRGIFLSFSGPVSQNLMVEIGDTLKRKMNLEDASKSTAVRVFSMVVENAQNIIHYSAEENHGIITVGCENDNYFVASGNIIENEKVESIRKRLIKLQKMTKIELNKFYREQRRKGPREGSKGGGLGFIEMARKATKPIEFHFEKINDSLSFFSLEIVI